ncbi:hypothetical protein [Saccharibacillus alkalitolerans]|uniref:SWIM-type domain-containing protein n=1 Tax=Saccharibacillus alkalitolerans TaxID=2705290 RepID=A0ABX0F927_9BACL|nr:hypothetical protein [Saccharibacillus alkalitolerans]NGZ77387.1 hypothetical protein [Saccharibacillus alkalitolerans]
MGDSMERRFRRLTALCTEDYLIRYANKGLYNRALKDMEKGTTAEYAFGTDEVTCTLDDGTVCVLTDSIERFDCSCPSDKICKHVLIGILYYARRQGGAAAAGGEAAANSALPEPDGSGSVSGAKKESEKPGAGAEEAGNAALPEPDGSGSVSGAKKESEKSAAGTEEAGAAAEDSGQGKDAVRGAAADASEASAETVQADGELSAGSAAEPADELPKPDFGWLLEREISELIAPFNASRVEEAAFRLRYREELNVDEGSLLVVRMNRSGVEVAFTDAGDVSRALCAVPGADGEMYKLEALLRYRASRGLRDEDALAGQLSPVAPPPELLREFRESVRALLGSGLARLPHSFAARFELLAIAARSGGLPNLEREARGIHGELELFFARHIRFSGRALLSRLTRVALMLEALERDIGPARRAQLAGRFRSRYYTVPRLDLYALGAEPWETRSGYRGITYYFYCAEDDGVYTYTQARPAYYEGAEFSFSRHYRERSPWKPELTLKAASASMLSFRSVKVSADGRLSSGGSPVLALPERPPVEAFDFGSLAAGGFAELAQERGRDSLFGAPARSLKLLKASAVEGCAYDRAAQALKLTIAGAAGDRLELTLPYHADWKTAINRLESGRGLPDAGEFYVFASIEEDAVHPISFLQGDGQINLKLDL